MPYGQIRGRRPFERASKIAHTRIIANQVVDDLLTDCILPSPPETAGLKALQVEIPPPTGRIRTIIAIDGGMNETYVRPEFPSASIAFMLLGPLLLYIEDLDELDTRTFIGPEDMQRLKKIERYSLAIPIKGIQRKGVSTFAQGVRKTVHDFLAQDDGRLYEALAWLLFRGWRPEAERATWEIPRCPNPDCTQQAIQFRSGEPFESNCPVCGDPIYLADGLRLYERIDEETGAGGILSYLLTALEQIVLVQVIQSVWTMKRDLLQEILFIKDGPLAFFGVTAPLYRPMRDLMGYLASEDGGPHINLVGLEKSGPFVEHASLIENALEPGRLLVLTNDYIYDYIEPGDSNLKQFGRNTYYGSKAIFRTHSGETYVVSIPTAAYTSDPTLADMLNAPDVLATVARLRCSMYDNALLPVVLANHLVSLADVPSRRILEKFARDRVES